VTEHPTSRKSTLDEILVFANPRAGRHSGASLASELARFLNEMGRHASVITRPDEFDDAFATLQPDAVVVAGGDGTLSLVLNRIGNAVPLAVLPIGTENLFARHYGMPRDPKRLAEVITSGFRVTVDAGRANDRLFLLMVGCGFDAEVVRQVETSRTTNHGYSAYVGPMFDALRRYTFPEMQIHWEGASSAREEEHSGSLTARWAIVANFPEYGTQFHTSPDADPTDGRFNLCALNRGSFWHLLRFVVSVKMGIHKRLREVSSQAATKFRIESDGNVPFQVDGDFGGFLPVEIEMLPGYLEVIVPRRMARIDRRG